MNERQAFLAAIRLDPDADAPRLVYADWLDERGEPERAAFIRYQIAAGEWVPGEWSDASYHAGLRRRFGLTPGRRSAGGRHATLGPFRRGFVADYDLGSAKGLADLGRLREIEPLPGLRLDAYYSPRILRQPGLAEALADAVHLELPAAVRIGEALAGTTFRCRRLTLMPDEDFGGPADALGGLNFPDLTHLRIEGTDPDDGDDVPLLQAAFDRFGPQLRSLELVGGEEYSSEALAALRWPAGLEEVTLADWDAEILRVLLASGSMPAVGRVNLTPFFPNRNDPRRALEALEAWPGSAGVRRLWLEASPGGGLLDRAARAAPNLEELNLTVGMGRRAEELDASAWPNLRGLSLEFLGHPPARLARSLTQLAGRVETLSVRNPPEGFFDGRESPALTRLRLFEASDAAVRRLAESPTLARLEVLDLDRDDGGSIGAAAVNALARSAFGPNLKALNLHRSRANQAVAAAVERHFGPRCDYHWLALGRKR